MRTRGLEARPINNFHKNKGYAFTLVNTVSTALSEIRHCHAIETPACSDEWLRLLRLLMRVDYAEGDPRAIGA